MGLYSLLLCCFVTAFPRFAKTTSFSSFLHFLNCLKDVKDVIVYGDDQMGHV